MNKKRKINKNHAGLLCFVLLVTIAFVFPLFDLSLIGQNISQDKTTIVNLLLDFFNSETLKENYGKTTMIMVGLFCLAAILFLINGLGFVYNRYSRYASYLTFAYFFLGLFTMSLMNRSGDYTLLFGLGKIELSFGVYLVPIVGLIYLIERHSINKIKI